ncbi:hypothetical protein T10_5440 [Trichinella papuae]|uniref:Uncharacterized protein n=1 Tax=Trichinella papuae TaxID=268474 RepID=A0A0V1MGA4_9BILA|nr:hypothetical protein T10_5440 [Trichinella papuae]
MGSIVVEKLPRGLVLYSLFYHHQNHRKRYDAIGAVALISCLVGEAAKPLSPPPAAATAAEHAFTFFRKACFYLGEGKLREKEKNNLDSVCEMLLLFSIATISYFSKEHSICLQLNILYLAVTLIQFKLLGDFAKSLRRNFNEFIILVDRVILAGFHFELLKGFLCLVARKTIVNVFDVGLSFPFAFPRRNIAQNWQTVAIPQVLIPTQAQHRNWKFCWNV